MYVTTRPIADPEELLSRLPRTNPLAWVRDGEGLIGYVDMWWPELNVIGEADGAVKYESKADLLKEKRREDREIR